MTSKIQDQTTTTTNDDDMQTPVDRSRRFTFVARIVTFCLIAPFILLGLSGTGLFTAALNAGLVKVYIEALTGMAFAVSLAYIGGSVVDYNGGFGFGRNPQQPKEENKGAQG